MCQDQSDQPLIPHPPLACPGTPAGCSADPQSMQDVPRITTAAAPDPSRAVRRGLTVLSSLAIAASMLAVASPASASDTDTRWDRFSESSACGDPFTRTPVASRIGGLADSESILGPFGTYFGRSVAEVRSKLRYWTVPQSGGIRVQVHKAMLPSLKEVAVGLEAHAKEGRVYEISSAWAFTPRTIAGRYHVSRHAMGLAIDFNPAQNPYRSDAVFISDMPEWFVKTWRDAGFCWGGDWRGSKDPMHFSWMGPGATPDPNDSLAPLAPKTSKSAFRGPVTTHRTPFGPVLSRYALNIVDISSNGASDVVGLRSHRDGSVIDIANSHGAFGQCSLGRWFVEDKTLPDADHVIFADVDGDSGQDIITLSAAGGSLTASIRARREGFEDSIRTATGASAESAALVVADFDGDHLADLWEATSDGRLLVWSGPGFTQLLDDSPLSAGAPTRLAAGDRDGGDRPELFALYPDGGGSRIDVLTHQGAWAKQTSIGLGMPADSVPAIGAGDYDGDGRADVQVLASNGDLSAYIGNTSTGEPHGRWFIYPVSDCDDPILLVFEGSFMDDDDNTFTANIESIAEAGVTRGCNPPFNDKFCPGEDVSREQMAAFIVRALGLSDNDHPGFADVASASTFAEDIGKLATAGITKGCNPPANDRFCPKDDVSREQMAAFIVRALSLTGNDHSGFSDVPGQSTFVEDIARLATAGITKGCNPPANTRYCPEEPVTRGQMAAFLDRAGLGR